MDSAYDSLPWGFPFAADAMLTVIGCALMINGDARMKSNEAAIRAMGEKYAEYVNSGDLERYMSVWAEEGIQMPPNAPAVSSRESIRLAMMPLFDGFHLKMSINDQEIKIAGDWAYSRGTYALDMTPKAGGDSIHVDGKALTIWQRQPDGSWLISRDCFNSNIPLE